MAAACGALRRHTASILRPLESSGSAHRRGLGAIDLVWIAGREFSSRFDQPLPLVLLGPQCAFRKEAIQKLDDAKKPWRIAAVSSSLAGLWASAIGGLGITARSSLGLPARLVWDKAMFDLPRLPSFSVTLHTHSSEMSDGVERLRAIIRDTVAEALRTVNDQSPIRGRRKRLAPVKRQRAADVASSVSLGWVG
jgi:hypothetical protein